MAFDPDRYEREVIRPLRGRHGRIADDLPRLYAVEPGMTGAQLQEHLRRLRTYWNQRASGPDSRAQVCKQLLATDEELQRTPGVALSDPDWWQAQFQRQAEAAGQAVKQLTADLVRAYGGTGQITQAQLDGIAAEHPALRRDQVDEAAHQAKLKVVNAVDLPTASGLDGSGYRELEQRLGEVGVDTVVHLLHPDLARPFTLVQRFGVVGGQRLTLGAEVVQERLAAAERAADSPAVRARKRALNVLRTCIANGVNLRELALFQIVERLAAARGQGLPDVLLIRQATRLGLTQEDAELVVASLPAGLDAGVNPAARVRELIGDGDLRAARQALAEVPSTDPEHGDVTTLVQRQEAELGRLLGEAETAVATRREEEAERLLRDAQRIARDDPDLERRLRRLPPPPPREPTAVVDGASVRLVWGPSPSAVAEMHYRVVCGVDRPPASPQDGRVVADGTATAAVDATPPVARKLRYAVFATGSNGAVWSRGATVQASLLPPVTGVTVHAVPDQITISWDPHPELIAVHARRTQGRPPRDASDGTPIECTTSSLVDRQIREGDEYYYALTAVYLDGRRERVEAQSTVISAAPRAPASPVDGLAVEPTSASGDGTRVRVSWPVGAGGGMVRVRYSPQPPPWEPGDTVTMTEIDRYGREVPGAPRVEGDRMVLEADVPTRPLVYLPYAFGGTGVVIGLSVEVGQLNSVRQLDARRAGDQVILTWIWPEGVGVVEVEWSTPDLGEQRRRISHSQYVDGGGCLLPVGSGGGAAAVRAISVGPRGESRSLPAQVAIDGRSIRLSYRVESKRGPLGRFSRQRTVVLSADQDCSGVELVVVAAPGRVMPLRVEQGVVVDRFAGLRLTRDVPLTFEVEMPQTMRRPYWIRCFATGSVPLTTVDPPVATLKVS